MSFKSALSRRRAPDSRFSVPLLARARATLARYRAHCIFTIIREINDYRESTRKVSRAR